MVFVEEHGGDLLCYGEGLEDEGVGEAVGLCFWESEDEVVLFVAAECEGAVVLAEESFAADAAVFWGG